MIGDININMKKFIIGVIGIILLVFLISCMGGIDLPKEENTGISAQTFKVINDNFENVKGSNVLFYDKNTKIIYYLNVGTHTSFICNYYNKNGKLCIYENESIIAIN